LCLFTDLPGGRCGMAQELTEKLIEKVREYVLYGTGHPDCKNHLKKAEAWREISQELNQKFVFFYISFTVKHKLQICKK
jgi:hypothetical protein